MRIAYTNQVRNVKIIRDGVTLATFQTTAVELYKPVTSYTYTGAAGTYSQSGTTYTSSSTYRNEYFWFSMGTGSLTLSVSWTGTADMDFYLYNSAGTQIGSSLGVTNPETKSFTISTAGVYYIRVYEYSGASTQPFTITVAYPWPWDHWTGNFLSFLRPIFQSFFRVVIKAVRNQLFRQTLRLDLRDDCI